MSRFLASPSPTVFPPARVVHRAPPVPRRAFGLVVALPLFALGALTASAPARADIECILRRASDGAGVSPGNNVSGNATACGIGNTVSDSAMAFGNSNEVGGIYNTAMGWMNRIGGFRYYGIDFSSRESTALGNRNAVYGDNASGIGVQNSIWGEGSTASGFANRIQGAEDSTAVGSRNRIVGIVEDGSVDGNERTIADASAFGSGNTAAANGATAAGYANSAMGALSAALGASNVANGTRDVAIGGDNTTGSAAASFTGNNAAMGLGNTATGGTTFLIIGGQRTSSAAMGVDNVASAGNSVAVGINNSASGSHSSAFGVDSQALNRGSTAIGYQAIADRDYAVSVGQAGSERQIIHVADGTADFDAANLRQLTAGDEAVAQGIAAWLGGGAAHANGAFTAPVYVIQSNDYNDVGSAFTAVDTALDDINERIAEAGGIQGERGYSAYEVAAQNGYAGSESEWLASLVGPEGPQGPEGPEGPAGGGPRVVTYDGDDRDALTLAGASGTTISNLADGVAATDAVNLRQLQAGDAATLQSARTYADAGDAATLASANAYTDARFEAWQAQLGDIDDRFRRQDRRIDRMAAMSGAYAGMAMNTAGLAGRNRIGVGVGGQGGETALAIGYQRAIGSRASVSFGGAIGGGEKSVMGGAGFSW